MVRIDGGCFIEVRDSRTGYLIPGRDTTRAQPNTKSSWETAAAAAAVTWKLRLTFRPRNYIWRFSYGFGLLVVDLGEWRPGFYTEFRCASREHSGLPWGAIFKKLFRMRKYTLLGVFLKIPCSFFQEQIPKMCSCANVAPSQGH